jgi:glycogen debranching enzyme
LRASSFQNSTDFTVVDGAFSAAASDSRRSHYSPGTAIGIFRRAESERGSIEQQHLKTLDNLASFCQNFTITGLYSCYAPHAQPFGLSRPFGTLVLAQPHAWAAAVLVDELDARLFKGTSDFVRCFRATRDGPIN